MSSSASKRKTGRWLSLAVVCAVAVYVGCAWLEPPDASTYITAPVTRGPIVRSVTATGTVNPVTVVQVGTYVSGPISQIFVDFNSPVKAGALMARIDPRPYQAQVDLARANLANSKAQLSKDQANLIYQKVTDVRDAELVKQSVVSQSTLDSQDSTYNQAVAQIELDRAAISQAAASLRAAELNLYYTNIISPVDGIVVSRNVDQGQTVAASYQTPTLFLVAQDLTKMQVDANVSESDVGGVRISQPVDFTVDAYTTRTFEGHVSQVRQAPITVQNVVTYDVVVTVPNPELLLMPGMTANITIVIDRREDVLRVPLRAVNFSPHHRGFGAGALADAADYQGGYTAGEHRHERSPRVWVETGGKIHPVKIERGMDDGDNVEVLSGDLQPGDNVVTGEMLPHEGEGGALASAHDGMSGMGGHGFHFPHM